jgi:hypothetical protein
VAFPHLLTNTGNSPDQYLLTLTQLSSAFSMTGLSVYASPDGQEIKTTGQTSDLQLER